MFGDPHLQTLDGLDFTFNGLGEYTLVDIMDGFIVLQGRTEKFKDDVNATIFTAFVVEHSGSTKFQISFINNTTYQIRLNDTHIINKAGLNVGVYVPPEDPGFSVRLVSPSNSSDTIVALWSSSFAISVTPSLNMFNILVSVPESFKNKTKGLLGIYNDNKNDDLTTPNGTTYSVDSNERKLFNFGETWRSSPTSSLFYYNLNESWNHFNDIHFVPVFLDELNTSSNSTVNSFGFSNTNAAQDICGTDLSCQYDVLATGDENLAKNTKETNSNNKDAAEKLENFPPKFTDVPQQLNVTVNQTINMTIVAEDPENGNLTYSLESGSEASIDTQSGQFMWTPVDTPDVQITFIASDERSATVGFQANVFLCKCDNGGKCLFDKPRPESNVALNKFALVECECPPGYTGSNCSKDYDACEDEYCYPGVTCIDNPPPSVDASCSTCPTGLDGDGIKCYDIDECQTTQHDCEQSCTNSSPGFECDCYDGYRLQQVSGTCVGMSVGS
ncbi:mucin-like protein [Antedon mediterranea]|uniref:mucin-like protein n=1 Tax=Antedon mediterranea TaxID=105859 RepID=UPI003AF74E04